MNNQNASHWMTVARKKGLDLDFLIQDKLAIDNALDRLDLPKPKSYIFTKSDISSKIVVELFEIADWFCRLVPHDHRNSRPYNPKLKTVHDFNAFLNNYDLDQYTIHLIERGPTTHTGAIVAQDQEVGLPGRCLVEMLRGQGPDLFHGKATPLHIEIDVILRIIRFPKAMQEEDRVLVYRALKAIGGPQHPFPGYYEFEVWNGYELKFRNYQKPNSAYAKEFLNQMY